MSLFCCVGWLKNNAGKRWRGFYTRCRDFVKWVKAISQVLAIPVVSGIVYAYLWCAQPKMPNLLGISSPDTVVSLLSAIIGALGSILGVAIAWILVVFELNGKTYSPHAFRDLFQDPRVRYLSILCITTIIIAVITMASVGQQLQVAQIDLAYLCLALFCISIVLLFPTIGSVVGSTQSSTRIVALLQSIRTEDIDALKSSSPIPLVSDFFSFVESNPIFALSEIGMRSIKDGDRLTARRILESATRKLIELLPKEHDKRGTIEAFLLIHSKVGRVAVEARDEGTTQICLGCFEEIHRFCANERYPWHTLIELNRTLRDLMDLAAQSGLEGTISAGFRAIADIMMGHLERNVVSSDHNWRIQLGHFWEEYVWMIRELTETAIDRERFAIARIGIDGLDDIVLRVILSGLDEQHKHWILSNACYYIEHLCLKCAAAQGAYSRQVFSFLPLSDPVIGLALGSESAYSGLPLLHHANILIGLAENGCLEPFSLDMLGYVGRETIDKIGSHTVYREALMVILDAFDRIRKTVEKNLTDRNKEIYLEAYRQLNTLVEWL
jgi:hypothetical protein